MGRATVSLLRNNTGRELDDVMLFAAVCVHGQQVHVARVEEQPASGYHANRDHVRIGRMEVSWLDAVVQVLRSEKLKPKLSLRVKRVIMSRVPTYIQKTFLILFQYQMKRFHHHLSLFFLNFIHGTQCNKNICKIVING